MSRILPLLIFIISLRATATEVKKNYFVGDVKILSPSGSVQGTAVMFLEKTTDQDKNQIIERGIQLNPDGTAYDFPMYLTISGSNFTIIDDRKTISGSGQFYGTPWDWSYFKATYVSRTVNPKTGSVSEIYIDDENTLVDPSVVTARKKLYLKDGTVIEYMDITLKSVTQQTFQILTNAVLKNSTPPGH